MSVLSRNAAYNMDKAVEEASNKRLLLDVKVETQVILQLLVSKGLVTREEVAETRERVKNSPNYKPLYDQLDKALKVAEFYKANPEQHLRDVLKAKMDGKIT